MARQTVRSSGRARIDVGASIQLALLWLMGALFLLPLVWMISSSLKPDYEIFANPPVWWPRTPRWTNYVEALTAQPFAIYARNTMLIAVASVIGHLLSCTVVAYGFARLRAPGRDQLFLLVLATLMLPYPVTMVPLYILFARLRLGQHLPAADRADLLRQCPLHFSAASVLSPTPDRTGGRRADRRGQPAAGTRLCDPAHGDARAGHGHDLLVSGGVERLPGPADLPAGSVKVHVDARS